MDDASNIARSHVTWKAIHLWSHAICVTWLTDQVYIFQSTSWICFPRIFIFMYIIQHCFICCLSDSTVSEDAGIEPRTFATSALTTRRSNLSATSHHLSARSHPTPATLIQSRLDLIPSRLDLIPSRLDLIPTPARSHSQSARSRP